MGFGTSFVKYVLFFFNLLFALAGMAMIGIGVAFLTKFGPVTDIFKDQFSVAPWLFIIVGSVVFVIAFFGCCGAIRESHCMVVTYAIFLLVIIIVEVAIAVLLFVYGANVKMAAEKTVMDIFDKRQTNSGAAETFNQLQEQLECCGKSGPSDYGITVTLPDSCCKKIGAIGTVVGGCTIADAKPGCVQTVSAIYDKGSKVISGVAIGVACIEIVGAIFALCLANSIRNMDRRYA